MVNSLEMKKLWIILFFISFSINILLAYLVFSDRLKIDDKNSESESESFPYLSKRIFTENQNDILINFVPLREDLKRYFRSIDEPIGLYFEYFPSGVSIGINANFETNIASLLKIPLVMGVYKEYERGNLKKNQKLVIKAKYIDSKFGSLWKKGEGAEVTIDEAVKFALFESDNTAANMLLDILPKFAIDDVADYLDIPKQKQGNFLVISPKNYSSVLRSLYLSAYLSRESSNEIIDLLTQTELNDKLPAPIANDVKVAHKIGVYTLPDSKEPTFSDCGIVYVPKRPYVICIMANTNEDNARKYIVDLSKMIYDYVSSAN